MKIIDISRDILTAEVYPGDPEPRTQHYLKMEEGDDCNLTALYMCLHNGTHIDAPNHFIEDGATVETLELERFIGECTVIEVPEGPIHGAYVDDHITEGCERLIVKGNGKAYFSDSGAFALASLGVKLVGTDANSVGTHGAQVAPHRAFLGNNIPLLEGLNLEDVAPGKYFLIAPPLKISGVEATPTRALLISDYLFWGKK